MSLGEEEIAIDVLNGEAKAPSQVDTGEGRSARVGVSADMAYLDYDIPEWDTEDAAQVQYEGVDADSRRLIEQMLAEEEYYFGETVVNEVYWEKKKTKKDRSKAKPPVVAQDVEFSSSSEDDREKTRKSKSTRRKQPGASKLSSADLPSHKSRWTEDEDKTLIEALEEFGYGNWRPISNAVDTRNPLQCKNHARHLVMSGQIDIHRVTKSNQLKRENSETSERSRKRSLSRERMHSASPQTVKMEAEDEEDMRRGLAVEEVPLHHQRNLSGEIEPEEIDIDIDSDDASISGKPAVTMPGQQESADSTDISNQTTGHDSSLDTSQTLPLALSTTSDQSSSSEKSDLNDLSYEHRNKDTIEPTDTPVDVGAAQEDIFESHSRAEYDTVSAIQERVGESENTPDFPLEETDKSSPNTDRDAQAVQIDPQTIGEQEQLDMAEWFTGKRNKTPERYMRIRNHMLDAWEKCKPAYLTKTAVRHGLKDCGDVNAMGRIHDYLERLGAINNVGEAAVRVRRNAVRSRSSETEGSDWQTDIPEWAEMAEGPRRRKVRNQQGDWVDPKDLEGRVISHVQEPEEPPKEKKKRKRTRRDDEGQWDRDDEYDPFQLVVLKKLEEGRPLPLDVHVESNVLLIMDFHCHLASTEVIGLLGGTFDNETRRLRIVAVYPCKSASTGFQCEMDPESEINARDVFGSNGLSVVGWYHSHPTFEPNPSRRDIETQESYQSLFHVNGAEPFVGAIVSPYDPANETHKSRIRFMSVCYGWNDSANTRQPYLFSYYTIHSKSIPHEVFEEFFKLVRDYRRYPHRIDLMKSNHKDDHTTKLDKLIHSLASRMYIDEASASAFLDRIRSLILSGFGYKDPT